MRKIYTEPPKLFTTRQNHGIRLCPASFCGTKTAKKHQRIGEWDLGRPRRCKNSHLRAL